MSFCLQIQFVNSSHCMHLPFSKLTIKEQEVTRSLLNSANPGFITLTFLINPNICHHSVVSSSVFPSTHFLGL